MRQVKIGDVVVDLITNKEDLLCEVGDIVGKKDKTYEVKWKNCSDP